MMIMVMITVLVMTMVGKCAGAEVPGKPILDWSGNQRQTLTWKVPDDSVPADSFIVVYELLEHKACPNSQVERNEKQILTTTNQFTLKGLYSYSTYKICVYGTNKEGHPGEEACDNYDTMKEDIRGINFNIDERTPSSVVVKWKTQGSSNCPNTYVAKVLTPDGKVIFQKRTTENTVSFSNLTSDTQYEMEFTIDGEGTSKTLTFSTLRHPPMKPVLKLESSDKNQLDVSWSLPPGSVPADKFNISYQFHRQKACENSQTQGAVVTRTTTSNRYIAKDLHEFSTYKICVTSITTEGQSEACDYYDTKSDVPQVTLDDPSCIEDNSESAATCSAILHGSCQNHNGPNFAVHMMLKTYLNCTLTYVNETLRGIEDGRNKIKAKFRRLIPGQEYNVTMTPTNSEEDGTTPVTTSFTTTESRPYTVRNLKAVSLSSSEVRLFWNGPCPPNGHITGYEVYDEGRPRRRPRKKIRGRTCLAPDNYDGCIDVGNLSEGEDYTFEVAAKNSAGIGDFLQVTVSPRETVPVTPNGFRQTRRSSSVTVHLSLPLEGRGISDNCTIELDNSQLMYSSYVTYGQQTMDIEIDHLEQGRRYQVKAMCCDAKACGQALPISVATTPLKPTFTSTFGVLKKTNSSITLNLPSVKVEGNGERSIAILVQHIQNGNDNVVTNYTEEYIRLRDINIEKSQRSTVPPSEAEGKLPPHNCIPPEETYIAGIFPVNSGGSIVFTVGSGAEKSHFRNCPLMPLEKYRIIAVAEDKLEGESRFAEKMIEVKAENDTGYLLLYIIVITGTLGLIMLLIIFVFVCKKICSSRNVVKPPAQRRRNHRPEENDQSLDRIIHRDNDPRQIEFEERGDGYLIPIMPCAPVQFVTRVENFRVQQHTTHTTFRSQRSLNCISEHVYEEIEDWKPTYANINAFHQG